MYIFFIGSFLVLSQYSVYKKKIKKKNTWGLFWSYLRLFCFKNDLRLIRVMELKTRYYKIPVHERKNRRILCEFCNLHFGTFLYTTHFFQCKENKCGLKNNLHLLDMNKCSFCKCQFRYKMDKIKARLRHYASCIKNMYGFH